MKRYTFKVVGDGMVANGIRDLIVPGQQDNGPQFGIFGQALLLRTGDVGVEFTLFDNPAALQTLHRAIKKAVRLQNEAEQAVAE
jgi:hypothetical protein